MNIVETIKSDPDAQTLPPLNESKIVEAQKELGLSFAPEFIEYAKNFGAALVNGAELLGINQHKRLSVVKNTLLRRELDANFPKDMYVIAQLGYKDMVALQNEKGEVFIYTPDSIVKAANSIVEYISKR